MEVTAGGGFRYTATSKAGEKLYVVQMRVDLMQGERVLLSGYTGTQAFVVFKKAP